jgi:hypothetical protein
MSNLRVEAMLREEERSTAAARSDCCGRGRQEAGG